MANNNRFDDLLLGDALKTYLDYCASHAQAPRTIDEKRYLLERFIGWAQIQGARTLGDITLPLFEGFSAYLGHYRKAVTGEPLALSTRRVWLTVVREWLRRMHLLDVLPYHPLERFELPLTSRRLPVEVFTVEDVERVVQQAKLSGLRDWAIIELLFATGLRTTELASLKLNDVDYSRNLVSVVFGKGRKDRVVPIAERTAAALQAYIQHQRPSLISFESASALFITDQGLPFNCGKLSRRVSMLIKRSGVSKQGSCRKFRHAVATLMLENGADIRVIQEMLGHADISTTQIYTRVSPHLLMETYLRTHPAAKM